MVKAGDLKDAPRNGSFVGVNARCSRCGRVHGLLVFEDEEVEGLDGAIACPGCT